MGINCGYIVCSVSRWKVVARILLLTYFECWMKSWIMDNNYDFFMFMTYIF